MSVTTHPSFDHFCHRCTQMHNEHQASMNFIFATELTEGSAIVSKKIISVFSVNSVAKLLNHKNQRE